MITDVGAVALRQDLGDMLNRVQYRRDTILIKKDGKPVAALVDAALFERVSVLARANTAEAWRSEGRLAGATRAQAPRRRAAAPTSPKSSRPKAGGKTSGR